MNDGHEHHHHDHRHEAPEARDVGSQALAEALGSSFTIVKIVMFLMVIAFLGSGFFTVGPQEKAVILRFGKPVGIGDKMLLGPGLHWSFPYPIDEVVRIPIAQIQTVTSNNGWYFTTPEQELSGEELPPGPSLNPAIDSYVLTADHNIIHTSAILSYHITDPISYIFNFANASNAVQNALDNALLYSAARFNADDIIINDVERFREAVEARVTDMAEQENLGIAIDQCNVQSIAPRQLADIFARVTIARETRAEALNTARNYENQVTNSASAQSTAIVNLAESAKTLYVDSINAEAKRFSDIFTNYETDPNLYVQQTFVQAIGPALTNVQDKWYLPVRSGDQPYQLRLQLNREPPQPPAPASATP
jgi:membrane protease subunit HflK